MIPGPRCPPVLPGEWGWCLAVLLRWCLHHTPAVWSQFPFGSSWQQCGVGCSHSEAGQRYTGVRRSDKALLWLWGMGYYFIVLRDTGYAQCCINEGMFSLGVFLYNVLVFIPFWIKMEFTSYIIDYYVNRAMGWTLWLNQAVVFTISNKSDMTTRQKLDYKDPNLNQEPDTMQSNEPEWASETSDKRFPSAGWTYIQ